MVVLVFVNIRKDEIDVLIATGAKYANTRNVGPSAKFVKAQVSANITG